VAVAAVVVVAAPGAEADVCRRAMITVGGEDPTPKMWTRTKAKKPTNSRTELR
jgi:hypothetical protein